MRSLLDRWTRSGYRCELGGRLLARYEEAHRRYHTPTHLEQAFGVLDHDAQAREAFARLSDADREAVELALWYHDAVYVPQAADNEERSADLFRIDAEALGLDATARERVVGMILASKNHQAEDVATRLFCDLDLSILGSDAETYSGYRLTVREEYRHLDEAAWQAGRGRVLETFLGRANIFRILTRREALARDNLSAELRSLQP